MMNLQFCTLVSIIASMPLQFISKKNNDKQFKKMLSPHENRRGNNIGRLSTTHCYHCQHHYIMAVYLLFAKNVCREQQTRKYVYVQNINMFKNPVQPIKRLSGVNFKGRAIKAMPPKHFVLYCDIFNLVIKFN